ncbi:MAG: phosphoribosylaminoimidazolesuccinocarboxamide synthase [Thermoprotei archaeon]|jgi:phosphoribosylaminoimidazole-succinocarboxamide synthase
MNQDLNQYESNHNLFRLASLYKSGKVRNLYDLGDYLLIFHSDRVSAFDVVLNDLIPFKGVYLNLLSEYWFLKSKKVFPNHFVERIDSRIMKVIKAKRIDIEWIVRGYLYGSAWRMYSKGIRTISGVKLQDGLQLAEKLSDPILTPTTKSEYGHDVEITKNDAVSKGLVSRDEWLELEEASLKLYDFYSMEAKKVGIIVADIKLEFGRSKDMLLQIDEPPTHDSARFWPLKYYAPGKYQEDHCLDKEFLRAYLLKIGYNGDGVPPRLPSLLVEQIALRVQGAYEVLTGKKSFDEFQLKSLDDILKEVKRDVK